MTEQNGNLVQPRAPHPSWSRLLGDETGQDLIEYALVAALVGLGAIAALKGLSTKIGNSFSSVSSSLTSAV
jgi:pilus assembly protein Flp/PilA